ncbi:unnamed protein product [Soboliphyme baturini]|uniref:Reverse transcriptase domain-containing protein n=1 Tax=Soboliphyme baturini TaxID=241478 RepID=A0A183IX93_9BILA|nr:unnamed protein product [Soboliphyme baturini]
MGCVHGRHSLALQEVQTEDDAYEPLERRHCTTTAAAAGRPIATSQQLLLNRSQVDPAELAPTDYVIKPTVGGKCGVYKAEHVQRSFLCHKWPSNKAFERNLQKLADSKDSIQADIEKLLRGILSSFPFPANAAMCAQPRSPPVTFVNHRHRRTDTVPKATSSNDQGVTEDRSCPCRSEMSIAAQYPLNYMVVTKTFDSMELTAMLNALPEHDINVIEVMNTGSVLFAEPCPISIHRGVRQGDEISPAVFARALATLFNRLN